MMTVPRLPAVHICGPNTSTRQRIRSLLVDAGCALDEGARIAGYAEAPIEVVCPAASDAEGLQALASVVQRTMEHGLEPGTSREAVAHLFVVAGAVERLRAAAEAVRGPHYFAIIQAPLQLEAVARQVDLAARWLYTAPPLIPLAVAEVEAVSLLH